MMDREDSPDGPERFEITDTDSANWYLKKLREFEHEKATIQAQTSLMLKAIEAEKHRLEFLYAQQFETWVRGELTRRGGKGKSLNLYQGTAAFRTLPAAMRVQSAKDAMEYARRQGWDVIKTTESLDAEAYKKQAAALRAETGEVLPGIEITEERENFSIKFGTTKEAPDLDVKD